MITEDRIRQHLSGAAWQVPDATGAGAEAIRRRSRARRLRRRTAGALLGLALSYPLVWAPAWIVPRVVADGGRTEVAVAMLPVPVDGRADGSQVVWIGAPGPEPQFDTSTLGPDRSFVPGDPSALDVETLSPGATIDTLVYLGDLDGDPMFVYSVAPPGVWDLIFEYAFGNWSGKIYGTSLVCCSSQAGSDDPLAWWGVGASGDDTGWVEAHAEWLSVPVGTSVVAYEVDGEPIGWQRPVGRVSMLELQPANMDVRVTAFDAHGAVLSESETRFSLGPG